MAKILIVDDDKYLLEMMVHRLQDAGHSCSVVTDGKSAIQRLEEAPADLLVLDLMLPGMSGFEVCRRVRADANWFTVPVLFISAMSSQEEVDHGLAQGADDFISKPFQLEQFAGRVESLLANSSEDRLVDKLTMLPGAAGMKLKVQNLVNRRKTFALMYIELLAIREFVIEAGEEARTKALRHFARVLHQCGSKVKSKLFRIGHMGGGHFVAIIETACLDPYAELAISSWKDYLPSFFEKINMPELREWSREDDGDGPALLGTLICSTKHSKARTATSKKLFETLSRLRDTAHGDGSYGHFRDRRG